MMFYTDNPALLDILLEQGIRIEYNVNFEWTISEEDAARIESVVLEHAPAAIHDYFIE